MTNLCRFRNDKMTDIKKTLKSQGLIPGSAKAQEMHFVGFLSSFGLMCPLCDKFMSL